jgi:hypothetical protein
VQNLDNAYLSIYMDIIMKTMRATSQTHNIETNHHGNKITTTKGDIFALFL